MDEEEDEENEIMDINYLEMKDRSGRTALNYAVYYGHTNCVMALLDKGCDFESKNSKSLVI